ncbi:hypothetical protein [Streptococcus suis]|nr:hypothetical protein [Streptococcus suis]MCQ9223841.1 hypothetical protein [Streptococcus suis]MCQ9230530.1 hypothetical protein [Streptococcus suis]UUM22693.1 hypothetical protein NQZ84_06890 [Streptococcus suis]
MTTKAVSTPIQEDVRIPTTSITMTVMGNVQLHLDLNGLDYFLASAL